MKDLPIKKMKELDIELKKSIYNWQIPELLLTPAAVPPLVFELAIPVLLSSESNEFLGCKISNIKFVDKQEKPRWLVTYISIVLQLNTSHTRSSSLTFPLSAALNNRVSTSLL